VESTSYERLRILSLACFSLMSANGTSTIKSFQILAHLLGLVQRPLFLFLWLLLFAFHQRGCHCGDYSLQVLLTPSDHIPVQSLYRCWPSLATFTAYYACHQHLNINANSPRFLNPPCYVSLHWKNLEFKVIGYRSFARQNLECETLFDLLFVQTR